MKHATIVLAILALVSLGGASQAMAVDIVWSGSTTTTWATGSNWYGGLAPSSTANAFFDNTSTTASAALLADATINSITFSRDNGFLVTAGAKTLTITSGITVSAPYTYTVGRAAGDTAWGNAPTFNVTSGGFLDVYRVNNTSANATFSGSGTTLLRASCNFADLQVNAGATVQFGGTPYLYGAGSVSGLRVTSTVSGLAQTTGGHFTFYGGSNFVIEGRASCRPVRAAIVLT